MDLHAPADPTVVYGAYLIIILVAALVGGQYVWYSRRMREKEARGEQGE